MTKMAARLTKLEKASPTAAPPRVIRLVAQYEGESLATAIDRWCKDYPNEPRPSEDDDMIILRSIVSPQVEHAT
jgi:hypothetical protein